MIAFCRNCGKEIDATARFCQHCGGQQIAATRDMTTTAVDGHRKDPAVAVLLSFVWSGAGQIYAGAINRGIWMIVIGFFLFLWVIGTGVAIIFALPFWIWCMFDARTQVLKQNQAA